MPPRLKRIARWTARSLAAAALVGALYIGWDQAHHNFGEVQGGRIYRSGQMPASALARTIRDYRIKTVLNLRGANHEAWYSAEKATTLGAGATQVDMSMSSCMWLSRAELRTILRTFDTAELPMLIHCQWGSERTGLISAFAELLRPGGTIEDARAQFSIRYLFLPVKDGKVMAEHLDQYQRWLAAKGWRHEPAHFRRWVEEGYHPEGLSRENWRSSPYPLVVISRPLVASDK
jgi:protein tyrosine phosphatase (PTP) superfamily phosphohydrolase (DUF442 family)